jgi:hypothetical protein
VGLFAPRACELVSCAWLTLKEPGRSNPTPVAALAFKNCRLVIMKTYLPHIKCLFSFSWHLFSMCDQIVLASKIQQYRRRRWPTTHE